VQTISKLVTEDQSMGGVYRYTDCVVAVLDAPNVLIMLDALESKCKFMLKTNLKLAWWRLWSLLGESILERFR
jgi:hypothetical protein